MSPIVLTAAGITFVFMATCLGAAAVFFFKKPITANIRKMFLGFAAGIMIAASVFSLLIPAVEEAEELGVPMWLPVIVGFSLGVLFIMCLDFILPHIHIGSGMEEGRPSGAKRSTLLMSAIILHNIPEGIAVGLAFTIALNSGSETAFASAVALAIGIGIHNFPEGATVSLLFRNEGNSRMSSFLMGSVSGAVDFVFALITIFLAVWLLPAMPWLLAFAAGAMMYVVVEEMIPEANLGEHSHVGTISVMIGFLVMMMLEVVLGH